MELGQRLQMSAGAVSMALAELLKWGAVKKSWQPGERRDFYEAETSIWKLVRRVIQERELGLVRDVGDSLARAEAALQTTAKLTPDLEFKRQRVAQLRELSRVGASLLASLVAGKVVDPATITEGALKS
jgi:DNA-binding transcriptional regulator GbsR (MarR family)